MTGPTSGPTTGPTTGLVGALVGRDVLRVVGPDAIAFLQGQLSQDVVGLAVGSSAWSLLLQPQGKVDAWLRVTRVAEDEALLDLDRGWGAAALARLSRFKLRTKAELTLLDGWRMVALRGPGAGAVVAPEGAVVAAAHWPAIESLDLLGPDIDVPDGVEHVDAAHLDALRIAAGVPALGRELDDSTIPAEGGAWLIERSVSFTKGCYTGQELVARVDSRGSNTPRKLRLVHFAAGETVAAGDELVVDSVLAGVITSVAPAAGLALAMVKRTVDTPADGAIAGRGVVVEIGPIPG